jgi:hypothetical protein
VGRANLSPPASPLRAFEFARRFVLLCVFVPSWLVTPAAAQEPVIHSVQPAGAKRGATTSLRLLGQHLTGKSVLVSGPGVTVAAVEPSADGAFAVARVTVVADAPLGPREIRFAGPKGVSAPVLVWLDAFPDLLESEPNDDRAKPQPLGPKAIAVSGRMQAEKDRDVYGFDAKAGETWVFDVVAARIRSKLDPVLELYDARGNLLKMAQSTWEQDFTLQYRFARAGKYTLTVRDTQFKGGPNYDYRIAAGVLPLVTRVNPRGERPGRTVKVQLDGVNLGGKLEAEVSIPAGTPPGIFWATAHAKTGPAVPFSLLVSDDLVAGLTESDAVMPLPLLPGAMDGAFQKWSSIRFFFQAAPPDRFVFDLLGRRVGSRIDGALRVTDQAGKELAANDDGILKDARLEFAPPADGVYTIELRNVEEKTGADCFYRLVARKVAPDFRIMLNQDRITLPPGGTVALPVTVTRFNGYVGEVVLSAPGLPDGISFRGATVRAGQESAEVTFTAAPGTRAAAVPIVVTGTGLVEGQAATRHSVPRSQYLPRSIDPALFTDDSYRQPFREWTLLPLAVTDQPAAFTAEVVGESTRLVAGGSVEFVVRAARGPGMDKEIKLELRGLPEKVTAAAPPIPPGQTETRVKLTAAADAPTALRNLIVQARHDQALAIAPALSVEVTKPATPAEK